MGLVRTLALRAFQGSRHLLRAREGSSADTVVFQRLSMTIMTRVKVNLHSRPFVS